MRPDRLPWVGRGAPGEGSAPRPPAVGGSGLWGGGGGGRRRRRRRPRRGGGWAGGAHGSAPVLSTPGWEATLPFKLLASLKRQLIDGGEFVSREHERVPLPREHIVCSVLTGWLAEAGGGAAGAGGGVVGGRRRRQRW